MADTGDNTPERLAGDGRAKPRTGGTARARGSRLWLWRWVLAPGTSWRARRLAASFGPGMDADTAWTLARLERHPDERPHALRRLNGDGGNAAAENRTP
ncbi:hypothetical protein [Streptomyces sp. NPDC056987]|uniref:hypothetical protein n=1 Tax=Streptomyces sp. NPDC056987 TaxID=3345988 RepID=UPI00362E1876